MSDLVNEFGKMLRSKRKEKGYSQESFAAFVGIERGNYGKMERGCVNIKLETLYTAALVVGSRRPGVTWHPAHWSP
nr:helix-turn-helix transcriptional regulator [Colwellia sp.]